MKRPGSTPPLAKTIVFVMQVPDSRIPMIIGFPDYREIEEDPKAR